ncbi:MAG: hypothetical protein ACI8W8_002792 [Rhodothermales bacterium]|jgi:hypothetical protein
MTQVTILAPDELALCLRTAAQSDAKRMNDLAIELLAQQLGLSRRNLENNVPKAVAQACKVRRKLRTSQRITRASTRSRGSLVATVCLDTNAYS